MTHAANSNLDTGKGVIVSERAGQMWRVAAVAAAALLVVTGCTQAVTGQALRVPPGIDDDSLSPVDVDALMLGKERMRAITGAGDDLNVIPSMDGKFPVDIDQLAETVPPPCRWIFAETQTFGDAVEEFHKTTFQYPPEGGLISEGVAGYRDPPTAQRAFTDLVGLADSCSSTSHGAMLIGDWTATDESLQTRPSSDCGRDYRVRSVVLVEVTSCGFSETIPDLVITNILNRLPG